jgi:hypothetical protein
MTSNDWKAAAGAAACGAGAGLLFMTLVTLILVRWPLGE